MLSNAYEGIKSEDGKNAVVELDVTFLKQEDDFPALLELCRKAKENRDLLVIVSRTVTEYVDRLRAIADLNMKAWQLGSYLLTRETITNTPVSALRYILVNGAPSLTGVEVV